MYISHESVTGAIRSRGTSKFQSLQLKFSMIVSITTDFTARSTICDAMHGYLYYRSTMRAWMEDKIQSEPYPFQNQMKRNGDAASATFLCAWVGCVCVVGEQPDYHLRQNSLVGVAWRRAQGNMRSLDSAEFRSSDRFVAGSMCCWILSPAQTSSGESGVCFLQPYQLWHI